MKLLKISFKALSPLHIGYGHELGIINLTRYYIPAKNIWGVFTANLTKIKAATYSPRSYSDTGKEINKNLRFTNFYPVISGDVCIPCYKDDGFYYGNLTQYEFESKVINSYISTAINYKTGSAEDGSLHEIEFMSNKVDGEDLMFEGYLLDKDASISKNNESYNYNELNLNEIIKYIEVGGERKYGYGRLTLEGINEDSALWEYGIYNGEIILNKEKQPYPFAIPITDVMDFIGDIEPVIERNWCEDSGSGRKISGGRVYISPGSKNTKGLKISIENLFQCPNSEEPDKGSSHKA